MKRDLRWYHLITTNIYYLGLTTVAQTNGLLFPLLIQDFVGETAQGTYLGTLRLWALMTAILVQALMGILSDNSRLSWGRRRPFILVGTLASMVFLAAVGFSAGMEGLSGFWFLFLIALLMQFSSNTAQAAQQGLIPDIVPEEQRGKFSGVKALLELPLPLLLVSFTVAPLIGRGQTWQAILLALGVLGVTMLLTMFVPEPRPSGPARPFNWAPILRLGLMAAVFTAVILGTGGALQGLGRLTAGLPDSAKIVIMFMTGLAAMLLAVAAGVWVSVRISLGSEVARRNPSFTWWVINRLAFLVGAVNLSIFAVYFIQARLGYEREQAAQPASLLMSVVGVFILLSALPSGWLADRFGRKPLVALSGFLAALGTLIALLSTNLALIYVGGVLIGIAAGLFYTASWALGTDLAPKEEAARYLGISNLAGAGAGAIGAYIGGPLADYYTVQFPNFTGLGYVILFAIYGALFLLSTLALTRVRTPVRIQTVPEAVGNVRAAGQQ